MLNKWVGVLAVTVLMGCTTAQETEEGRQVAAMSTCDKINALIEGHAKGFPRLRTSLSSSKYMEVWKARYHLVGDACQVWGSSSDKFSYVCSLTEPNKEVAMEHYTKAKSVTRECLSGDWSMQEGPRDMGEGSKAEFSRAGTDTVVTIVAAASPTVFKTEWKTYYLVGNPNAIK